jgi:CsoR family transcriptional regulator, copper-sensing transcriptional repressor
MTTDTRKQVLSNLNRIEGQIRGLKRLIEEDTYCIDVITQTQAVKSAISSVEDRLLREHLFTCAVTQVKKNDTQKMVDEVMKVYQIGKKK